MKDESPKNSKLSWSKKLVRRWFSNKSKCVELHDGDVVHGDVVIGNGGIASLKGNHLQSRKAKRRVLIPVRVHDRGEGELISTNPRF
ncbi:hypothetical protein OROGR_028134 [Orobanche gracilis]